MLDDSRRSSIKILKEDHICILSIWFDCFWLFLMVANPGRLWKMAAIITKNRKNFFLIL
jgi:hypothetical protein